MKKNIYILLAFITAFILATCSSIQMHAQTYAPKIRANSNVSVTQSWNLNGKTVYLPDGVTLNIKSGEIKNGTIVGKNTKLAGTQFGIFNNVKIEGSWNVPNISSNLFVNLSEDNALRNVMALTDSSVSNVVTIEQGNYSIKLGKNHETGICVKSNTTLVLNGTIHLKSNAFSNYNVIEVTGNNITIKGTGTIIGDKNTHIGKAGEWGMGLNVSSGSNVCIYGLTIKDCWGDCIYIGNKSKNIIIDACTLLNGRRQGISITSADTAYISNCMIKYIAGTDPEYAIDIEPNKNDSVTFVRIEKCRAVDCKGGYLCWGRANRAHIGTVIIDKCTVEGCCTKYPFGFNKVEAIAVNECCANQNQIFAKEVKKSILTNNRIGRKSGRSIYKFDDCKPTILK